MQAEYYCESKNKFHDEIAPVPYLFLSNRDDKKCEMKVNHLSSPLHPWVK